MEIKSTLKARSGAIYDVEYYDVDSYDEIRDKGVIHIGAFCFYEGKLLIVHDKDRKTWTPIGGSIEPEETIEEALVREIKEEGNMKVLHHELIGYQQIHEPHRLTVQSRSFCIVEPYGPFTGDPDGDIDEIKLINPEEYKKYFDWGIIQEHVAERVKEKLKRYYNK